LLLFGKHKATKAAEAGNPYGQGLIVSVGAAAPLLPRG